MGNISKYVIGVDKNIPDWVKESCKNGRIKFNYEDEELIDVTINIQNKTIKCFTGDVIVNSKNGISVIDKKVSKNKSGEE